MSVMCEGWIGFLSGERGKGRRMLVKGRNSMLDQDVC